MRANRIDIDIFVYESNNEITLKSYTFTKDNKNLPYTSILWLNIFQNNNFITNYLFANDIVVRVDNEVKDENTVKDIINRIIANKLLAIKHYLKNKENPKVLELNYLITQYGYGLINKFFNENNYTLNGVVLNEFGNVTLLLK